MENDFDNKAHRGSFISTQTVKAENSTNENLIENYMKYFGKAIKVALFVKICAVLFHIDEYIIF